MKSVHALLTALALGALAPVAAHAQSKQVIDGWTAVEDEEACSLFRRNPAGDGTNYAVFGPHPKDQEDNVFIENPAWTHIGDNRNYDGQVVTGELGARTATAVGAAFSEFRGYSFGFPLFDMVALNLRKPIVYSVGGKEVGRIDMAASRAAFQWLADCSRRKGGM